jgi:hypothetical protein
LAAKDQDYIHKIVAQDMGKRMLKYEQITKDFNKFFN